MLDLIPDPTCPVSLIEEFMGAFAGFCQRQIVLILPFGFSALVDSHRLCLELMGKASKCGQSEKPPWRAEVQSQAPLS